MDRRQLFALLAKNITGSTTSNTAKPSLIFRNASGSPCVKPSCSIGLPGQAKAPTTEKLALQAALRSNQPLQHLGQGRWRTYAAAKGTLKTASGRDCSLKPWPKTSLSSPPSFTIFQQRSPRFQSKAGRSLRREIEIYIAGMEVAHVSPS